MGTEFISFIPYEARYLEHEELIRRKPTRVSAARELNNTDLDICVHGIDQAGAYYGFFRWSDYLKKPRIAAWIQRRDFAVVASMMQRLRRKKNHERKHHHIERR